MSVQIYEIIESTGRTASGYWATNTLRISGALLKHVFVDFENNTSEFELKVIDNKDRNIIYLNSCNTVINRTYDIPVKGIYTLVVSNATVDTAFKVRFATQDHF